MGGTPSRANERAAADSLYVCIERLEAAAAAVNAHPPGRAAAPDADARTRRKLVVAAGLLFTRLRTALSTSQSFTTAHSVTLRASQHANNVLGTPFAASKSDEIGSCRHRDSKALVVAARAKLADAQKEAQLARAARDEALVAAAREAQKARSSATLCGDPDEDDKATAELRRQLLKIATVCAMFQTPSGVMNDDLEALEALRY